MNFEKLDYRTQLYWLKNYTNEIIEDYSMLGSYSDNKNKKNLDSFNDSKSNKKKYSSIADKYDKQLTLLEKENEELKVRLKQLQG